MGRKATITENTLLTDIFCKGGIDDVYTLDALKEAGLRTVRDLVKYAGATSYRKARHSNALYELLNDSEGVIECAVIIASVYGASAMTRQQIWEEYIKTSWGVRRIEDIIQKN